MPSSDCSRGRARKSAAVRANRLRPSIEGAIFQICGATTRTPGTRRRASPISAGRSLKMSLGAFSRSTRMPWTWASVSPRRLRIPPDRPNRPSTPRTGIDRPTRARPVRIGRVNRLRTAKTQRLDRDFSKAHDRPAWLLRDAACRPIRSFLTVGWGRLGVRLRW